MAGRNDGGKIGDGRDGRDGDRQKTNRTSGNREESMTESAKDAFGKGGAVRNPGSSGQSDRASEAADADRLGQTPASSGTTSLGGEPRGGNPEPGPGGIEGETGRS